MPDVDANFGVSLVLDFLQTKLKQRRSVDKGKIFRSGS